MDTRTGAAVSRSSFDRYQAAIAAGRQPDEADTPEDERKDTDMTAHTPTLTRGELLLTLTRCVAENNAMTARVAELEAIVDGFLQGRTELIAHIDTLESALRFMLDKFADSPNVKYDPTIGQARAVAEARAALAKVQS